MTAQQIFCVGYPLTLIMFWSFFALFKLSPTMQDFKRAGSKDAAAQIWKEWGTKGQQSVARRNLTYDWFFIVVYSTTWVAGAVYFGSRFEKFGMLAWIAGAIGLIGAASDIIENRCLLQMLRDDPSDSAAQRCKRVMKLTQFGWAFAAGYFLLAIVAACVLTHPRFS